MKIIQADGTVEIQRAYSPRELQAIVKERMVSPAKRQKVLARDKGTCRYCYGNAEVVDHVIPIAKGGTNRLSNLVAACGDCNTRKGTQIWKVQPRRS